MEDRFEQKEYINPVLALEELLLRDANGQEFSKQINVYCPECPPGGTIGHPGGQQKKFLLFGHGRDLVAFNGTGL